MPCVHLVFVKWVKIMGATSIITVLIVIVALTIAGLISSALYEPLDEEDAEADALD